MNFIADTGLDNTGSDDTAMEFIDNNTDGLGGVAMDCIDGNSVWLHMLSCFEPDRCQDPLCHAGKAVLGHRLGCQVRAGIPCFYHSRLAGTPCIPGRSLIAWYPNPKGDTAWAARCPCMDCSLSGTLLVPMAIGLRSLFFHCV